MMNFNKAQREIHNTIMGDTPVKTVHNRQYIDNISAYDSELQRISKSVHHKLDLGPNSLLGAQQYTTVEAAATIKAQDKTMKVQDKENALKTHMLNDNGQYKREIYRRAEYNIPQLDDTYNVSDSSHVNSYDYLDLTNTDIIQYKTRGQKKRQKAAEAELANMHLANIEIIKPNTRARKQRQKVPDNEEIDMDKIAKDDMPRYTIKRELKDVLHARKLATEIERQLKENRRLQADKVRQLQIEKDIKEKEAKRCALEKAKIAALLDKHRSHTPSTPDEVNKLGTGINADTNEKEGTEKAQPPYKKATKASQIKSSQNKGTKPDKDRPDALLGDPIVNTKKNTKKSKATGRTDSIDINDIGIYEIVFEGLPNPPDLGGVDEDRLFELQRNVQEQLHKRDKEKERNITKRVKEFEKTFDFVNSHLLKGVATMAELTKTDTRQSLGKIKPTDKMVMMPGLFDGTKLETSKQHYEKFNMYIKFQTKSSHLTDPVREAIDLFEHTLDKTALVWFQTNRSKFKDLTTLKTMFLQ